MYRSNAFPVKNNVVHARPIDMSLLSFPTSNHTDMLNQLKALQPEVDLSACKISSEETIRDTTIHIRNQSDFKRLSKYKKAIVYRHISGGVANQLNAPSSSHLFNLIFTESNVDFDNSIDKNLYVHRSDDAPVFSVDESLFKLLHSKQMISESCWMRDIYGDMRHVMTFRHAAVAISKREFSDYLNHDTWVLLDGNCLYYYYWLDNPANVKTLVSRGYLSSLKNHFRHTDQLVKELTQRIVETGIRFRPHIVDLVNCVLEPFRSRLIPAEPRIHTPPFARFSNLIAVHARFGSGLADFVDSREFLPPRKLQEFVACVESVPSNAMVFVASDAIAVKLAIREALGDRVFSLPILAGHSDESMRLPGQKEPVGVQEASVVWLLVDMIVGSMGSRLIGTEGSTFSTMMGMMGDPVYMSVSKYGSQCERRGLYLPK